MPGTGIDISPQQTIAVEVARVGSAYRITRSAFLSGFDHDPSKPVADAKKSPLASGMREVPGALRRNAAVSLPARDVIFRTAELGADNVLAQRSMARMEAEEVRGSGSEVLWGSQLTDAPSGSRMLIIGVTRAEVAEHLSASLAIAGIRASSFVPAPVALYQTWLLSGPVDAPGYSMVVSIGEQSTDMAVVQQGNLIAVRSVPIGVQAFVQGLSSSLGINSEQARSILFSRIDMRPGHAGTNVSGERSVAAAQDVASRLLQQIMGTVPYARAQVREPRIDVERVCICGSGVTIRGLPEYLASRMRKPFELLDPLAGFDRSGLDDESARTLAGYGPALAVALGLARVSADNRAGDMRIIPPSIEARRQFLTRTIWLYAATLVIIAGLSYSLLMSISAAGTASKTRQEVNALKSSYDQHHREIRPRPFPQGATALQKLAGMTPLQRDGLLLEQRLVELTEARRPTVDATALLADLMANMATEVTLISYALVPQVVEGNTEPLAVELGIFIENSSRSDTDVYLELQTWLRAHQRVERVEPALLRPVQGGIGSTTTLRIWFHPMSRAIAPAGGEVGR